MDLLVARDPKGPKGPRRPGDVLSTEMKAHLEAIRKRSRVVSDTLREAPLIITPPPTDPTLPVSSAQMLHNDFLSRFELQGGSESYKSVTHYIYSSMVPSKDQANAFRRELDGHTVRIKANGFLFGKVVGRERKLPQAMIYNIRKFLHEGYQSLFDTHSSLREKLIGSGVDPFEYVPSTDTLIKGDTTFLGINSGGNGLNVLGDILGGLRTEYRRIYLENSSSGELSEEDQALIEAQTKKWYLERLLEQGYFPLSTSLESLVADYLQIYNDPQAIKNELTKYRGTMGTTKIGSLGKPDPSLRDPRWIKQMYSEHILRKAALVVYLRTVCQIEYEDLIWSLGKSKILDLYDSGRVGSNGSFGSGGGEGSGGGAGSDGSKESLGDFLKRKRITSETVRRVGVIAIQDLQKIVFEKFRNTLFLTLDREFPVKVQTEAGKLRAEINIKVRFDLMVPIVEAPSYKFYSLMMRETPVEPEEPRTTYHGFPLIQLFPRIVPKGPCATEPGQDKCAAPGAGPSAPPSPIGPDVIPRGPDDSDSDSESEDGYGGSEADPDDERDSMIGDVDVGDDGGGEIDQGDPDDPDDPSRRFNDIDLIGDDREADPESVSKLLSVIGDFRNPEVKFAHISNQILAQDSKLSRILDTLKADKRRYLSSQGDSLTSVDIFERVWTRILKSLDESQPELQRKFTQMLQTGNVLRLLTIFDSSDDELKEEPRVFYKAKVEGIRFSEDQNGPFGFLSPMFSGPGFRLQEMWFPSVAHYVFYKLMTPHQLSDQGVSILLGKDGSSFASADPPNQLEIIQRYFPDIEIINFEPGRVNRVTVGVTPVTKLDQKIIRRIVSRDRWSAVLEINPIVEDPDNRVFVLRNFKTHKSLFDGLPDVLKENYNRMFLKFAERALKIKLFKQPFCRLLKSTQDVPIVYYDTVPAQGAASDASGTAVAGGALAGLFVKIRGTLPDVSYEYIGEIRIPKGPLEEYIDARMRTIVRTLILCVWHRLIPHKEFIDEEVQKISFQDLMFVLRKLFSSCDFIDYNQAVRSVPTWFARSFIEKVDYFTQEIFAEPGMTSAESEKSRVNLINLNGAAGNRQDFDRAMNRRNVAETQTQLKVYAAVPKVNLVKHRQAKNLFVDFNELLTPLWLHINAVIKELLGEEIMRELANGPETQESSTMIDWKVNHFTTSTQMSGDALGTESIFSSVITILNRLREPPSALRVDQNDVKFLFEFFDLKSEDRLIALSSRGKYFDLICDYVTRKYPLQDLSYLGQVAWICERIEANPRRQRLLQGI